MFRPSGDQTGWVESPDGAKVQGWLVKPVGYEDGKVPLILSIHGGPHGMYGPSLNFTYQLFAQQGIAQVRHPAMAHVAQDRRHRRRTADRQDSVLQVADSGRAPVLGARADGAICAHITLQVKNFTRFGFPGYDGVGIFCTAMRPGRAGM